MLLPSVVSSSSKGQVISEMDVDSQAQVCGDGARRIERKQVPHLHLSYGLCPNVVIRPCVILTK